MPLPLPTPHPHSATRGLAPRSFAAVLALGAALASPLFLSGCGGSHAGSANDPSEPPTTLA